MILPPRDPNDLDLDGVPNDIDVCPTVHDPEQHDEDGDGVGDACDVCPQETDPDQSDLGEASSFGIGDHIGDACDPRVTRDGDRLANFDSFAVDTSARWRGTGWRIGADVARTVTEARWEKPEALQGDGLYVQIHASVIAWLSDDARIEVAVNGDGVVEGASCAVVRDTDGDGSDELIAREIDGMTATMKIGKIPATFTLTAWRTISFARRALLECRMNEQTLTLSLADEIPAGTYAFASRGAITDVSSIAVYTFPVNPCAFKPGAPHECENHEF